MKKLISLFVFTIILNLSSNIYAEDYKLLTVYKGESINIGDKEVKVGQMFNDEGVVEWTETLTTIKALRKSDKKIVVFSKQQFANTLSSSLSDYMKQIHHLSTRGESESETIREQLDGYLPIGKGIIVKLDIEKDTNRWFAIRWKSSTGEDRIVRLMLKENGTALDLNIKSLWDKKDTPQSFIAELIMGSGEYLQNEEIIEKSIEIIPL